MNTLILFDCHYLDYFLMMAGRAVVASGTLVAVVGSWHHVLCDNVGVYLILCNY